MKWWRINENSLYTHIFCVRIETSSTHSSLSEYPPHIPNLRLDSMQCRISILYRGSKMCRGQGIPGKAIVQGKTGRGTSLLSPTLRETKHTRLHIIPEHSAERYVHTCVHQNSYIHPRQRYIKENSYWRQRERQGYIRMNVPTVHILWP